MAELLRRGWTEQEVRAALADNLLRVFRKVEEVSGARGGAGTWGRTAERGTRVLGDVGGHRDTRGSTVRVPRGGAAHGDPNSPQEPTLSPRR